METNKIKVFTAFSGYDSQCLGLNRLKERFPGKFDYELVGWSEIEDSAIKAHDILFPEAKDKNYGDISKINWKEVPNFDLFTYSSPCFIAGTRVITINGEKNIEEVKCGDMVLTHTGQYQKVIETYSKLYFGDLISIGTVESSFGSFMREVTCTPNHPFMYINKEVADFIQAEEIKENTKLLKFAKAVNSTNDIYLKEEVKKMSIKRLCGVMTIVYNLEVENDHTYTANRFIVHNCTDFSLAGRMAGGEEGSGTRSSLLWECDRCIREKRPKYLLFENVTALVSEKFMPLFKRWCDRVEKYGYTNFYQTLNAKDYGIPQNRDRVFMVSIRNDGEDVQYQFPSPKIPRTCKAEDYFEDNVSEKYYINQEKVDEWSKDNAQRIKEYIAERNNLSDDDIVLEENSLDFE